ncbi:MAG: hypothetical protein ACI94N_001031, partial [Candidatus Arcticimaribacter sp.]
LNHLLQPPVDTLKYRFLQHLCKALFFVNLKMKKIKNRE